MSLLSGIMGGMIGAEVTNLVSGYVERHGGLAGLQQQFEQAGFGEKFKSWVGTGENLPISSDEIHKVMGTNAVQQLAAKFGIAPEELTAKLSEYLPKAVDLATPNGTLPEQTQGQN